MGFYFAQLAKWDVLRLGELWASLFKETYPSASLHAPFGSADAKPELFTDPSNVSMRGMFTTDDGTELVQVQGSAFFRNWRKTPENESYTHYRDLRPKFLQDWQQFVRFLTENGFREPNVFQCEVSYVNRAK